VIIAALAAARSLAVAELFVRKEFGVYRLGARRGCSDVERGVDGEGYGGQADFGAAGLVTQL
jgi:hypothetical protein